jgi:hypothetical protein
MSSFWRERTLLRRSSRRTSVFYEILFVFTN